MSGAGGGESDERNGREIESEAAPLADLRDRIHALDRQLLRLMAERVELARGIGVLKRRDGSATLDPAREAAVIRSAVRAGRGLGLPEEPVREMFWTLVGLCRAVQLGDR